MRGGPTSGDGAGEHPGEVALKPALGDEFFHGAADPVRAVAVLEAAFEESLENAGSAVWVVPDQGLVSNLDQSFSKMPWFDSRSRHISVCG